MGTHDPFAAMSPEDLYQLQRKLMVADSLTDYHRDAINHRINMHKDYIQMANQPGDVTPQLGPNNFHVALVENGYVVHTPRGTHVAKTETEVAEVLAAHRARNVMRNEANQPGVAPVQATAKVARAMPQPAVVTGKLAPTAGQLQINHSAELAALLGAK